MAVDLVGARPLRFRRPKSLIVARVDDLDLQVRTLDHDLTNRRLLADEDTQNRLGADLATAVL
jgi:hypothetical protein